MKKSKPKLELKRRPLKTIPTPPERTAAQLAVGAPKAETLARTGAPDVALTLARTPQSLGRS